MGRSVHLIVALCFAIGLIAPACGFAWGGKFSVVEICTAQGLEQKIIPNNANDGPNETPAPAMKKDCPFCLQHASAKVLPIETASQGTQTFTIAYKQQWQDFLVISEKLNTQHAPRAPPLLKS